MGNQNKQYEIVIVGRRTYHGRAPKRWIRRSIAVKGYIFFFTLGLIIAWTLIVFASGVTL